MIDLTEEIKEKIRLAARLVAPREAGGIFLNTNPVSVLNIENVSPIKENHYLANQTEIDKYKNQICGFWHSHTDEETVFNQADIYIAEKLKLDSVLYCVSKDSFNQYNPNGYETPYVGRKRYFKILDCLSLVIDYYEREFNIKIDYFEHPELNKDSDLDKLMAMDYSNEIKNIHYEFMKKNGFNEVNDLKKHDILCIRPRKFKIPTHFAIYLGENQFLHQLQSISMVSVYTKPWKERTLHTFRHQNLM